MTAPAEAAPREAAERMAVAAAAWLDALEPDQRAKATFDFGDTAERTKWAYFPSMSAGLPVLEMDARQQKLMHRLLASALSTEAYTQAVLVMASESLIDLREDWRLEAMRDPRRYFLSIFGTPGTETWGWRFEGHHLVLNYTITGGAVVSATPLFLGAQPSEVRNGGSVILRTCAAEEDAARELLASLDAEQRQAAILSTEAPPDFVLTNLPSVPASALPGENAPQLLSGLFAGMSGELKAALRFGRAQPRGLAGSRLRGRQQATLSSLIDVYVGRLPAPLARLERAKVDAAGLDGVHFAWAGDLERRRGHYYRVQGPELLIEYDNTQNDVTHAHSVWRDMDSDFGADVLREHLRAAHQP